MYPFYHLRVAVILQKWQIIQTRIIISIIPADIKIIDIDTNRLFLVGDISETVTL